MAYIASVLKLTYANILPSNSAFKLTWKWVRFVVVLTSLRQERLCEVHNADI